MIATSGGELAGLNSVKGGTLSPGFRPGSGPLCLIDDLAMCASLALSVTTSVLVRMSWYGRACCVGSVFNATSRMSCLKESEN